MFEYTVTPESARKSAKKLHKYLKSLDVEIKLSQAQEATAHIFQHKDWNRLIAHLKNGEAQTSIITQDNQSSILNNVVSNEYRNTLRIKISSDKNDNGNANISEIYSALKSFIQEHRKRFNRVFLPEQAYDSLSDVEIYQAPNGRSEMRWLKLVFGDRCAYVRPKELDIFTPSNSLEYTYLRLETEVSIDPSNFRSSVSTFTNVIDERIGLPMLNDDHIDNLLLFEQTSGNSADSENVVKKYNRGTFLMEPFEPYLHESNKIKSFENNHIQTYSLDNDEYHTYIYSNYKKYLASKDKYVSEFNKKLAHNENDNLMRLSNTSIYGPIIPAGFQQIFGGE